MAHQRGGPSAVMRSSVPASAGEERLLSGCEALVAQLADRVLQQQHEIHSLKEALLQQRTLARAQHTSAPPKPATTSSVREAGVSSVPQMEHKTVATNNDDGDDDRSDALARILTYMLRQPPPPRPARTSRSTSSTQTRSPRKKGDGRSSSAKLGWSQEQAGHRTFSSKEAEAGGSSTLNISSISATPHDADRSADLSATVGELAAALYHAPTTSPTHNSTKAANTNNHTRVSSSAGGATPSDSRTHHSQSEMVSGINATTVELHLHTRGDDDDDDDAAAEAQLRRGDAAMHFLLRMFGGSDVPV